MMRYLILSLLLVVPNQLFAQYKVPVAVLTFEGRGISINEALTLSDRLRAELVKTDSFTVMERKEMEQILREQAFQLTGACSEISCIVQVGQLVAVQKMVGGSIAKIGGIYTVDARLIDVKTGIIEKSVVEDYSGSVEGLLTEVIGKVARQMAGIESIQALEYGLATLYVRTDPSGGAILIDGEPSGLTAPATIKNIKPGEHKIAVQKEYLVKDTTVSLEQGKMTAIHLTLEKKYGGRLSITGTPNGIILYRNDTIKLGELPLVLENVEYGKSRFISKRHGYYSQHTDVLVEDDSIKNITTSLIPKPILAASWRSAIVPGWGQLYMGRRMAGWLYAGSAVLSGALTVYYADRHKKLLNDYDVERESYNAATNEAEAIERYTIMESAYEKANKSYGISTGTQIMTTIVWCWNVVDNVLFSR